ncbi:MAG: PLP-dependent aminotransferase family protein, partial [Pseudomonadota bacterium]
MAAPRIPIDSIYVDRGAVGTLKSKICESIVAQIASGTAIPGARLPSTRRLATHIGVSRPTVALAYQDLAALGFIQAKTRSAFHVADSPPIESELTSVLSGRGEQPADARRSSIWEDRLDMTAIDQKRRIVKPADWRSYRYPFIYGQMDPALFDTGAWRECARRSLGKDDFFAMASDVAAADDPLLIHQIRTQILPRRGIQAGADEILVTIGAQNALWLATQILSRTAKHAVCENPGYPDTANGLRWGGVKVTHVDVDGDGLPPDAIPECADVVFLSPSHQAPTGVTMPIYRRQQLMDLAQKQNLIIVEDEYDFEMNFFSAPRKSLKATDEDGRVIYIGSFSKSIFPGIRLGYLVADKDFIACAREIRGLMFRHPPGHLQRITAYFISQGYYSAHLRRLKRIFTERRKVIIEALHDFQITIANP